MENSWWIDKAKEIQQFADSNDTHNFYNAIKAVYGPSHHSVHPVRSKDGSTLFKDRKDILSRWAEHLRELLNCVNPTDPSILDKLPQLRVLANLDTRPSFEEV